MNPADSGFRLEPPAPEPYEPAFRVPKVILWLFGSMAAVHVWLSLMPPDIGMAFVLAFAFDPLRYAQGAGFSLEAIWSPITYSFLHSGWPHLLVNALWGIAFGSPVARRFGTRRTLILAAMVSAGGAAAHWIAYAGESAPVIGASAITSGFAGAAIRFAFRPPMPGATNLLNIHAPAPSLVESFSNRRFIGFLAVWMGINLLFGIGSEAAPGDGPVIAWQAHIGGFLSGMLGFALLEPRRKEPET